MNNNENPISENINAGKKKIVNDLTSGPVFKQLTVFALPLVLSNILQTVYSIVDMIFVGQYVGSSGLSAVGISGQVVNLFMTVAIGVSFGGQILISQQVGARDFKGIKSTIGTTLTTLGILSVLIGLIGIAFCPQILGLMNTPAQSVQDAKTFLLISCIGMPFIYGYNAVSAILRGMGDSKLPFVLIAISSIVNVILDIIFVALLHMGVAGAGLATVSSQALSFITAIIYLYKHRESFYFDFKLKSFRIDYTRLRVLFRLAVPITFQSVMITFSMMFVTSRVNSFGLAASAVDSIGGRLHSIMNIVSGAMSAASASMMGQNFGARNFDRMKKVYRSCLAVCMSFWVIVSILILPFPTQIFSIFTTDPEVLNMAPQYLKIAVVFYLAFATMAPPFAVIEGIGHAKLGLLIGILDGVVTRILLSIILSRFMGLPGLWLGNALAGFVTTILAGGYYYSNRWKSRKLLIEQTA